MTHTEAEQILGYLVGATSGWTNAPDETFVAYANALGTWRDYEIALEAVEQIVSTWTEARRPPIAALNGAYSDVVRRRAMNTPAIGPAPVGAILTLEEGRRVAADAYAETCKQRAHDDHWVKVGFRSFEPSSHVLDSLLGVAFERPAARVGGFR